MNSFILNGFQPVQPFITASSRVVLVLSNATRSYRVSSGRPGLVTACARRTTSVHLMYPSKLARFSFRGEQPDCPSLRASREHILIVRPRRARRVVWLLPSLPLKPVLHKNYEGDGYALTARMHRSPSEVRGARAQEHGSRPSSGAGNIAQRLGDKRCVAIGLLQARLQIRRHFFRIS